LLDQLGPGQFDAVVNLFEVMVRDDDEELTGEDRQAAAVARNYFR
jgi:hypothetical protein